MRTKIQNITKQSTRTEKNSKKEQQNNYIIDNNKMQPHYRDVKNYLI